MLVILVVPPLQISTIWWIAVCPEAQRGWILPWWSPTGIISRHFHQQQLHLANASTLTRYAKTPFPLKDRRVAPAGVVRRSSRSGEARLRPCASAFQCKPCEYLLKGKLRKPLFLSVHKFVASPEVPTAEAGVTLRRRFWLRCFQKEANVFTVDI